MSSVLYVTPPPLPPQYYPMPIDPYTGFGIYVAKADETCQRVGDGVGGAARVRERERATAHLTGRLRRSESSLASTQMSLWPSISPSSSVARRCC